MLTGLTRPSCPLTSNRPSGLPRNLTIFSLSGSSYSFKLFLILPFSLQICNMSSPFSLSADNPAFYINDEKEALMIEPPLPPPSHLLTCLRLCLLLFLLALFLPSTTSHTSNILFYPLSSRTLLQKFSHHYHI